MWPTCEHGYYTTPSHRCPWCFNGDVSKYRHVVGKGNGWLLKADDLACEGCGGPRGAGWGAWCRPEPPTPELVREVLSTMSYCYSCTREGKAMKRTAKKGERISVDEQKRVDAGVCPDCGKRYYGTPFVSICPRATCGSRIDNYVRTTDAHPDEPPKKYVNIG
jgi:hypothetical protein